MPKKIHIRTASSGTLPYMVYDEDDNQLSGWGTLEFAEVECLRLQKFEGMIWNSPEVNHPDHYGGKNDPYETIKIWAALGWLEPACLSNALKYIMRAGKKDPSKKKEDLEKGIFYLQYLVDELNGEHSKPVQLPVKFVPLSDLQAIIDNAKDYLEMGREYPLSGVGNLIEHLEETITHLK